jgi:hypothetical protein
MEEQEEDLARQVELDTPKESLMAGQLGEDDGEEEVLSSYDQESKTENELWTDIMA